MSSINKLFTEFLLFGFFLLSCSGSGVSTFAIDEDNLLVVPVSVFGNSEASFVFDTGAEATVISKKMADVMALDTLRVIQLNGRSLATVNIPKLLVGKWIVNNVEAVVVDMDHATFEGSNYAGIIGLNLINLFVWDFDLKKKEFTLYDGSPVISDHTLQFPFNKRASSGYPFLSVEHDLFTSDSLFFDTGYSGFLYLIKEPVMDNLQFVKNTDKQKYVFGEKDQQTAHYLAKDFLFFNQKFDDVPIRYSVKPILPMELLGMGFVLHFNRFVFDPFSTNIYLSK